MVGIPLVNFKILIPQEKLYLVMFLSSGSNIRSVNIGARAMPDRKNIQNLKNALEDMCSDWEITPEKVLSATTDNGANIKQACSLVFGAEKHLSCFTHNLNLVASNALQSNVRSGDEDEPLPLPPDGQESGDEDQDDPTEDARLDTLLVDVITLKDIVRKIKRIVRFFRSSERASEELKRLQKEQRGEDGKVKTDADCLKLIQEVSTRWNSTYFMIERFLLLGDVIARALTTLAREKSTKTKPPIMLSVDEEEITKEICELLKPLAEVTVEISSEKTVTISKVIPMVRGISRVSIAFT